VRNKCCDAGVGFLGCSARARAYGSIVVTCHDDMNLPFISLHLLFIHYKNDWPTGKCRDT